MKKLKALLQALIQSVLDWFRYLLAFLLWLLGQRERRTPRQKQDCMVVPPEVARAPDPCLYSQTYLAEQGLSVTWNNPDIQVTTPGGSPVSSHDLAANTQYLVIATIHNASFDAAIGVEVICVYRPWSFGTEERVPVESDPGGGPAVRAVNIGPWSSTSAVFEWTTPPAGGHFCLQVECFHSSDREPNNNLGQENTNVLSASSPADFEIPLQNLKRIPQRIRLRVDEYTIPDESLEMTLERIDRPSRTTDRRKVKSSIAADREASHEKAPSRRGAHIRLPTRGGRRGQSRLYGVHGYSAGPRIRQGNGLGRFPVNDGWAVTFSNAAPADGGWTIDLPPLGSTTLEGSVHPGPAAQAGDTKSVNFNAFNENGSLLGGVTIAVEVA